MKKNRVLSLIFVIVLFSTGCWTRMGNLTMIATRNIDTKTEYKLIQKYVVGKAPYSAGRALEEAIDRAVKKCPDGEFLRNIKVYTKNFGRRVKVEGDVWGASNSSSAPVYTETKKTSTVKAKQQDSPNNTNPKENVNNSKYTRNDFKYGEIVTFLKNNKSIEGRIVGLNENSAIIEVIGALKIKSKQEVNYGDLNKTNGFK